MAILDRFDIKGRSALVTGAASGIGLAYAEAMAEAGALVTLTDIDGEGAEREAARLRDAGHEVRFDRLDVSDFDAVAAAFDVHAKAYGGLGRKPRRDRRQGTDERLPQQHRSGRAGLKKERARQRC